MSFLEHVNSLLGIEAEPRDLTFIERADQVKLAYVERNGEISVVPKSQ